MNRMAAMVTNSEVSVPVRIAASSIICFTVGFMRCSNRSEPVSLCGFRTLNIKKAGTHA
jgi:hypothetical protein